MARLSPRLLALVLSGLVLLTLAAGAIVWRRSAIDRCSATPPGMESSPDYPAWRHERWELRGRTCIYDGGEEELALPILPWELF